MYAPYGFLNEHPMPVRGIVLRLLPVVAFVVSAIVSVHEVRSHNMIGTFRTTNLQVDQTSNVGAVGTGSNVGVGVTNIDGPTRQTIAIPGGDYDFGELNLSTISGTVPDFPHDLFVSVIRNSGSADTTLHTSHSGGIAVEVTGTRTAGANDMTNTAFECEASGAQNNECIHMLAGDFTMDGGGAFTQNSGTAFFAGSFLAASANTPIIAEGNGLRALYISADPGPTDSIYSNANNPTWNAHHATLSTLKLYNDSGPFRLNVSGPVFGVLESPNAPTGPDHGALGTGSTEFVGNITGIGANTSVTLTFANVFPSRSWCFATTNSTSTPQIIVVTNSASAPVFSCFTPGTTPVAASCSDFSYQCYGQ